MKCRHCGRKAQKTTKARSRYTWGTEGITPYGRHVFYLPDTFYECTFCGVAWYDMELSYLHSNRLNEAIKKRLGIDWLAECAARRLESKRLQRRVRALAR